jgi:hypothetical protein
MIFALVMLAILMATILCFIIVARDAAPGHIGADRAIGHRVSKTDVLVSVVPVSLLISVSFLIRPLWDSVPLYLLPFVFFPSFWVAEGRSDYVRAQTIEFLRILSGVSSGFFAALLWLQLRVVADLSVPALAPPIVFFVLGALLLTAGIRHCLRLLPSRWSADDA